MAFIPYTTDQLFDMLAETNCHTDVIEVNYYLLEHIQDYTCAEISQLMEVINHLHYIFLDTF